MSRKRLLAAFAASVALLPVDALAAEWSESFPTAAAASHLAGAEGGVLVVTASEGTDASEAAAALAAGLRGAEGISLVMDGAILGDSVGLDDPAILARSAHLPVSRIAVVRFYPGSGSAPGSAVVSVYDKAAVAQVGFAVRAGGVLAMREEAGQGEGVSTRAAEVGSTLQEEGRASRKKASEEYDKLYIGFDEQIRVVADAYSAMVVREGIPYQGKSRRSLEGATFYEVVGRDDLASSYRTRNTWKQGLIWGGYTVAAAGIVWGLLGPFSCDPIEESSCMNGFVGPVILTFAGFGTAFGGHLMNPHPVRHNEIRGLAEEYNDGLKSRLGLVSRAPHTEEAAGVQWRMNFVSLGDGKGGVGLSGTF